MFADELGEHYAFRRSGRGAKLIGSTLIFDIELLAIN